MGGMAGDQFKVVAPVSWSMSPDSVFPPFFTTPSHELSLNPAHEAGLVPADEVTCCMQDLLRCTVQAEHNSHLEVCWDFWFASSAEVYVAARAGRLGGLLLDDVVCRLLSPSAYDEGWASSLRHGKDQDQTSASLHILTGDQEVTDTCPVQITKSLEISCLCRASMQYPEFFSTDLTAPGVPD